MKMKIIKITIYKYKVDGGYDIPVETMKSNIADIKLSADSDFCDVTWEYFKKCIELVLVENPSTNDTFISYVVNRVEEIYEFAAKQVRVPMSISTGDHMNESDDKGLVLQFSQPDENGVIKREESKHQYTFIILRNRFDYTDNDIHMIIQDFVTNRDIYITSKRDENDA